ncbi:hypothetical protein AEJ54_32075 [Azospirillum sp. Sp 7]|nr:hypothetical protein AEJ54_32075 [Azospirillum sp. Sp 7]
MGDQMQDGRTDGERCGQNGVGIVGGGDEHDLDVGTAVAEQPVEILKSSVRDDDFVQGKLSVHSVVIAGAPGRIVRVYGKFADTGKRDTQSHALSESIFAIAQ